jgi:hypothetical protein
MSRFPKRSEEDFFPLAPCSAITSDPAEHGRVAFSDQVGNSGENLSHDWDVLLHES